MDQKPEDKPPFFNTWNGMYAFVLGFLVFLIIVFYYLTLVYNVAA